MSARKPAKRPRHNRLVEELLTLEDPEQYQAFCQQFLDEFDPRSEHELELVQSLAHHHWLLRRIPGIEYAVYTRGQEEFAHLYPEYEPAMRVRFIEVHTHRVYERELNRLHIEEERLHRQRDRIYKELKALRGNLFFCGLGARSQPPLALPPPPPAPQAEPVLLATYLPNDFAYSDR